MIRAIADLSEAAWWAAGIGGAVVVAGAVLAVSLLSRSDRRSLGRRPTDRRYGFEGAKAATHRPSSAAMRASSWPAEPPMAASSAAAPTVEQMGAYGPVDVPPHQPATAEPGAIPPAGGNLLGILRWLATETDADAVALLEVGPGQRERLLMEPRGLPASDLADLAQRARAALLEGPSGEVALPEGATSRWLGVGGVKSLLLTGVSSVAAAEPLRFARSVIEWLSASGADPGLAPLEDLVVQIPGIAWAEVAADGSLRVMGAEGGDQPSAARALEAVAPGVRVEWISLSQPPILAGGERRARLVDVAVYDIEVPNSAEVRLDWDGAELRGIGRAESAVAGGLMAAARAAVDAVKPLVHGDAELENLYVFTFPPDLQVVVVSVLVGDERLIGAVAIPPDEGERAAAKAVLDAVNRRLAMLAGRGGRL